MEKLKKNEIATRDTIELVNIYKEYPKEIENDVPQLLIDYYDTDEISNMVNWDNVLSYGYMFKQFRKRNQYLAEFKCLETGKSWFGGVPKRAYDISDRVKTPIIEKRYTHDKTKLILIEGLYNKDYSLYLDYEFKIVEFEFNSGDFISELNRHLNELKKLIDLNKFDYIVINKWYLEELNKIKNNDTLNHFFKTDIELHEFLVEFEEKLHNLFDFNKLIITLDSKRENYLKKLIHKSKESKIYINEYEIKKIILDDDFFEKSKNQINCLKKKSDNIYQQALKNEFFLNYIDKIPCNTYSKIGNDFFFISDIIKNIVSKKKPINRYKIHWTDFIDFYTDDDNDIDYFGEDFLFYENREKIKSDFDKKTTLDDEIEIITTNEPIPYYIDFQL